MQDLPPQDDTEPAAMQDKSNGLGDYSVAKEQGERLEAGASIHRNLAKVDRPNSCRSESC